MLFYCLGIEYTPSTNIFFHVVHLCEKKKSPLFFQQNIIKHSYIFLSLTFNATLENIFTLLPSYSIRFFPMGKFLE